MSSVCLISMLCKHCSSVAFLMIYYYKYRYLMNRLIYTHHCWNIEYIIPWQECIYFVVSLVPLPPNGDVPPRWCQRWCMCWTPVLPQNKTTGTTNHRQLRFNESCRRRWVSTPFILILSLNRPPSLSNSTSVPLSYTCSLLRSWSLTHS